MPALALGLQTAEAAAELHAEEISEVVGNLEIEGLQRSAYPSVLLRGVLAAALWLGLGACVGCL